MRAEHLLRTTDASDAAPSPHPYPQAFGPTTIPRRLWRVGVAICASATMPRATKSASIGSARASQSSGDRPVTPRTIVRERGDGRRDASRLRALLSHVERAVRILRLADLADELDLDARSLLHYESAGTGRADGRRGKARHCLDAFAVRIIRWGCIREGYTAEI